MDHSEKLPEMDSGEQPELLLQRMSNELNAQLTTGLIHEVNNVLTGIYFNVENCQEVFTSEHPSSETLEEIQAGLDRIKVILNRSLQIYLNTIERDKTYHDLEDLLVGQMDLMKIVLPRTTKLELIPSGHRFHVHLAEYPFRVVLLSIAEGIRNSLPTGKNVVSLEILEANREDSPMVEVDQGSIVVVIQFPTKNPEIFSKEISDLTYQNAKNLAGSFGAHLIHTYQSPTHSAQILFVLPPFDINS
jgi:hypothetical protein